MDRWIQEGAIMPQSECHTRGVLGLASVCIFVLPTMKIRTILSTVIMADLDFTLDDTFYINE